MNIYHQVLETIKENKPAAIQTCIHEKSGNAPEDISRKIVPAEPITDEKGRRSAKVTVGTDGDSLMITEPVLPQERLIILGGGHIAEPLCQFAAKCGFTVCLVDDRPEFANAKRFPEASRIVCDRFENAIAQLNITPFDYVVVITRGHRSDADCLRKILPETFPAYLGMIGSRRRVKAQLELLAEEGFKKEKLDRICTPIGLKIGAVTPAEIAVSIMAEVISYRRLPEFGSENRYCNDSDVELSVLEYLAENTDPKAIVTVIETKGSSPRGAGAKMAVSPLGKVIGSIGGGCSEAAVIRDAVSIIGTGRYKIKEIDMTGDVAENDGMVCGGIMRVLIEDYI